MEKSTKVGIIVVYHDTSNKHKFEVLSECIKNITEQSFAGGIKIFLINNGENNKIPRELFNYARIKNSKIELVEITNVENHGIIIAKNRALLTALKDKSLSHIATLDSNSIPAKNWVKKTVEAFHHRSNFSNSNMNIGFTGSPVFDLHDTSKIVTLGHYQKKGATLDFGYKQPRGTGGRCCVLCKKWGTGGRCCVLCKKQLDICLAHCQSSVSCHVIQGWTYLVPCTTS